MGRLSNGYKQYKKVLNHKTFYPALKKQRKSRMQRRLDLIKWYIKYGTVNLYYNEYGFDIKNFKNQNKYYDAPTVRVRLSRKNGVKGLSKVRKRFIKKIVPNKSQAILTRDKYLFSLVMRDKFGDSFTPKVHCVYFKGKPILPNGYKITVKEHLEKLKNNEKICFKLLDSQEGKGFILVAKENNKLVFNYGKMTENDFWKEINNNKYLVSDYIYQHSKMKEISPGAVCTIRIVTFKTKNGVELFSSAMRIGKSADSVVDNFAAGGLIVGIKDGKLRKYGHNKKMPCVTKHPVTGTIFKDFEIPYYDEAVKLVMKGHRFLRSYRSLGWDVAITENGPTIIEANVSWDIPMMQVANGGLKDKLYDILSRI